MTCITGVLQTRETLTQAAGRGRVSTLVALDAPFNCSLQQLSSAVKTLVVRGRGVGGGVKFGYFQSSWVPFKGWMVDQAAFWLISVLKHFLKQ